MSQQEIVSTEAQTIPETPVEEPPPGSENSPQDEKKEVKPGDEIPAEVLRRQLTAANHEAAGYRTRLREAESRLASSKTIEEFEAATTELVAQVAELERSNLVSRIAARYELPETLAKRLAGADEAELEADAKELQKLMAPQQSVNSLSGGLDPADSEVFDPVSAARAARKRR